MSKATMSIAQPFHVYFIDSVGNDNNNGTIEEPWISFEHAQEVSKPGDTIYVRGRNYLMNAPIIITDTGSYDLPVVYSGYNDELPIFDFTNSTQPDLEYTIGIAPWGQDAGIINLYKSNQVVFQKVRVINSPSAGIQGYKSKNIQIRNCSTYNTYSSGASAWDCDSIIIDGNNIELACHKGAQECISISRTNYFQVSHNEIHHTTPEGDVAGGEGLDCKESSHYGKVFNNHLHHLERIAMYIDSWNQHLSQIELYGNIIHDAMFGFGISTEQPLGQVDSVDFHHNLIYNCPRTGIILSQWGTADENRNDITIRNNTIDSCGWERVMETGFPHGGMVIESKKVHRLRVINNIFSNNCSFQIAYRNDPNPEAIFEYNMIQGYNSNPLHNHLGDDIANNQGIVAQNYELNIIGSAEYVDKNVINYNLKESSLAINAGSPDPMYNDANGTRNDLGAFPSEYLAPNGIQAIHSKESFVFPNPADNTIHLNLNQFTELDNVSVELFSVKGENIYRTYSSGAKVLEISKNQFSQNLNGTVFIRVSNGQKSFTEKLMLK